MSLTFLAAAMLVAVAAPVSACDKSAKLVASAAETRSAATFTGEFVNGAPVYRLPAITVVGRRHASVAKTQRNNGSPHDSRFRASGETAAPAPGGTTASATRDVNVIKPCIG